MEAAVELDCTRTHFAHAGYVLDALRDLVPGRVELISLSVARGRDGLVRQHEWVQRDDLGMRMQDVDGQLARDEARDGRDDGEDLLFAKHF